MILKNFQTNCECGRTVHASIPIHKSEGPKDYYRVRCAECRSITTVDTDTDAEGVAL